MHQQHAGRSQEQDSTLLRTTQPLDPNPRRKPCEQPETDPLQVLQSALGLAGSTEHVAGLRKFDGKCRSDLSPPKRGRYPAPLPTSGEDTEQTVSLPSAACTHAKAHPRGGMARTALHWSALCLAVAFKGGVLI